MDNDLFGYFFQCTSWLSSIIDLAIAVTAFMRLKATPAGLLIGGGFTLMGLFGIVMRIARMMIEPDFAALDFDADYAEYMMQSNVVSSVSTCGIFIFMTAIGIGFFLLPKSLEKLAAKDAPEATG